VDDIRRGLRHWLPKVFQQQKGRKAFTDLAMTLPIGSQLDGYSCGVCVINAMECAVLGAALFDHKDRYALRVRYFVDMVTYLYKIVSRLLSSHLRDMH
jgi:hypothetical protein